MNPADQPATGDDFQPKLVYLARRNPRYSRAGFVTRWRKHGALGMSLPRWRNIARYVHCDVADGDSPSAGLDVSYDGIGLIWHRSKSARSAHLADTDSRLAMEQDEAETFAEPVVATCLVAREWVLRAPPGAPHTSGGGAVGTATGVSKLLRVYDASDPAPHLAGAWRAAQLEKAGIAVRGQVLDLPLPPERGTHWGLDAALLEEWWFEDDEDARRAAIELAAASPARLTLLTNEVLLYCA